MSTQHAQPLSTFPIHLGLGATSIAQPAFTGPDWFEAYGERHAQDGIEGRLVSMFTFLKPWDMWEMHPNGSEVVICTTGQLTLIQEQENQKHTQINISPGEYAINPAGVWHTVDVGQETTGIFITAGVGTQHRQR